MLSKRIWFKPFSIDHFHNRVFVEFALHDLEILTSCACFRYGPTGTTIRDASPAQEPAMLENDAQVVEHTAQLDFRSRPIRKAGPCIRTGRSHTRVPGKSLRPA